MSWGCDGDVMGMSWWRHEGCHGDPIPMLCPLWRGGGGGGFENHGHTMGFFEHTMAIDRQSMTVS